MNRCENTGRIQSLQGLRFIAFLLVFLQHTEVLGNYSGTFGVSIFFCLSGFVAYYSYAIKGTNVTISIKEMIVYTKNKVLKFAFLYEVFMVLAILGSVIRCKTSGGLYDTIRILANIFMVQSWIPDRTIVFSYNAATWFLSTLIFLYFISIPLIRLTDRIIEGLEKERDVFFVLLFLILGLFLFSIIIGMKWSNDAYDSWYWTYVFPISRVCDYFCGCILGKVYFGKEKINEKKTFALQDFFLIGLGIGGCILYNYLPNYLHDDVLFLPISLLIIWRVSNGKGALARIMETELMVYLGNIGLELFICHSIVLEGLKLLGEYKIFSLFGVKLVVTVIVSIGLKNFKMMIKRVQCRRII